MTYTISGKVSIGGFDYDIGRMQNAIGNERRYATPFFNMASFITKGINDMESTKKRGMALIDGTHYFDGVYLHFMNMTNAVSRFVTPRPYATSVPVNGSESEHPVIHRNLFGKVRLGSCGVWDKPEQYFGVHLPECVISTGHESWSYKHFSHDGSSVIVGGASGVSSYTRTLSLDEGTEYQAEMYRYIQVDSKNDLHCFYTPVYRSDRLILLVRTVRIRRFGLPWMWEVVAANMFITAYPRITNHGVAPSKHIVHLLDDFFDVEFEVGITDPVATILDHNPNLEESQNYLIAAPFKTSGAHSLYGHNFSWLKMPESYVPDERFYAFTGYTLEDDTFREGDTSPFPALYFYERYMQELPQLVGACAYSASDAMESILPRLENNYLETISEIRTILQPLTWPKTFLAFLRRNVKKSPNAVRDILETVADYNIAYSFGLAPNIRAAMELRDDLLPILEKLTDGSLCGPGTYHGKRVWENLIIIGDDRPVNLRAGTKVSLNIHADSILPYILPADTLGFLPTLSRLWEVVPWSWLIDYGFNVKELLRLIDVSTFQLLADINYSVNTLKIDYHFQPIDCARYNFMTETDGAGYRLFSRYILRNQLPHLGPMHSALYNGERIPPIDILGSLAILRTREIK
jgi:hypothetical protein